MRRPGLRGSFWPTPTQEALLRLTLGPRDRAGAIWRELDPIDVGALEAGSFCVLPLLYESLSDTAPDDPRLPRLLGTYRNTWYKNHLLLQRVAALLPGFRERGIEPLLVGGAAIALRWYPRLGCRPVPEVELIVDVDAGPDAREAARVAGWRPAGRTRIRGRFVDGGGRVLVVHEGAPPLVAGPVDRVVAHHALRDAAQEHEVFDESVLVLQPSDELLFICALGARTLVFPSVQWLLDTSKLLASPDRPAAGVALARARAFHLVEPLRDTVAYLAQVSEAAWIDEYLDTLAAEPVLRRDSLAYRLGGTGTSRFGGMPLALGSHLRANSTEPLLRVIARFPHHLQESWEAESVHQLPAIALKKLTRLARQVRRKSAGPRLHV